MPKHPARADPPEVVRTVAGPLSHEIEKVRGSRFLADVRPVATREEAEEFVAQVREAHRDATHNCFAWRLGLDPEAVRYSDDGEPSGTAGRPIANEIHGRGLTNVAVVVSRWFGGTKLGTGGLIRAYGAAASGALDRARVLERPVTAPLTVSFAYGATGKVQGVLAAHGLEPVRSHYGTEVGLELAVPIRSIDALCRDLRDATHGTARIEGSAGEG